MQKSLGLRAFNRAVWRQAVWSIGDRLETSPSSNSAAGGRWWSARTTQIWKLEVTLKWRSCDETVVLFAHGKPVEIPV
jgi:hypothetical protein